MTDAPFALTMGDPAGIGPEIVVKLAASGLSAPLLVVGDIGMLRRTGARLGLDLSIVDAAAPPQSHGLRVLQVGEPLPADLPVGRVDARAGAAAFGYVRRAIELAMSGEVAAVVTAPINKAALAAAGVRYPGHTEMLADLTGSPDVGMMLANDELRVVLVSIHVALADAIAAVTPAAELRAIRLAHAACQAFGIARPRIAVAGLNPHAGEDGLFGREEQDAIAPAIARALTEGMDASGPWPGDTVFMQARRGAFDAVVAQYHDQGLIPVKYLGIERGVNVTLGLPFVRTSPDHGTAFDIAGTGRADPASLAYALEVAVTMTRARRAAAAQDQEGAGR